MIAQEKFFPLADVFCVMYVLRVSYVVQLTCRHGNYPMSDDHSKNPRRGLSASHNGSGSAHLGRILQPTTDPQTAFRRTLHYRGIFIIIVITHTTGVSLPLITCIGRPVSAAFLKNKKRWPVRMLFVVIIYVGE